jgi:endonuclease YncB( thermonuclease family)
MTPWPLLLALLALAGPINARADPCEAPLPSPPTRFSGPVRYVGDGDSLCVGPTSNPATWIEVRLADFSAPELHDPGGRHAKAMLEALVQRQYLLCRARKHSYDRVVADCTLNGTPVGDLLRARGAVEGGN